MATRVILTAALTIAIFLYLRFIRHRDVQSALLDAIVGILIGTALVLTWVWR